MFLTGIEWIPNRPGCGSDRSIHTASLRRRYRDLRQRPDGLLYVATSDRSDEEPSSGAVLRIEPAD
jgi:glucose/arabinose dehydrogenase